MAAFEAALNKVCSQPDNSTCIDLLISYKYLLPPSSLLLLRNDIVIMDMLAYPNPAMLVATHVLHMRPGERALTNLSNE